MKLPMNTDSHEAIPVADDLLATSGHNGYTGYSGPCRFGGRACRPASYPFPRD